MRFRAVIFDLWETLIDWDPHASGELLSATAQYVGVPKHELRVRWRAAERCRSLGPIRDALRAVGVPVEHVEDVCAIRLDYARRSLVPRPEVVGTLRELRGRGHRLGVVSVCSEEVAQLWDETEFAGLFDAEVFSCAVGLSKPDPRVYRMCLDRIGIDPDEALFVGDGCNDELAGAARAGLTPVLLCPTDLRPRWPEARAWEGLRIAAIPDVLDFC